MDRIEEAKRFLGSDDENEDGPRTCDTCGGDPDEGDACCKWNIMRESKYVLITDWIMGFRIADLMIGEIKQDRFWASLTRVLQDLTRNQSLSRFSAFIGSEIVACGVLLRSCFGEM